MGPNWAPIGRRQQLAAPGAASLGGRHAAAACMPPVEWCKRDCQCKLRQAWLMQHPLIMGGLLGGGVKGGHVGACAELWVLELRPISLATYCPCHTRLLTLF